MAKSTKNEVFAVDPKLLNIDKELAQVYKIKAANLKALADDMRVNGYQKATPVIIWRQKNIVVDGMTRTRAALQAGLVRVWATYMDFDSLQDVKAWMEHNQHGRRNIQLEDIIQILSKNIEEYKQQKNKQVYLIQRFKIKARQATSIMSIINNPAKLQAVLEGESVSSVANKKTETVKAPIIRTTNKLLKLISDTDLSETDIEALQGVRRAIGQVLRSQKTA